MPSLALPLYVICTSAGLIFLKLASSSGVPIGFVNGKLALNLSGLSVLGLGLYAASFLLYLYLISKFQLGYVIPVTAALVYIIVFTASFLLFKEPFSTAKILGILLILGGLFLLNQGK